MAMQKTRSGFSKYLMAMPWTKRFSYRMVEIVGTSIGQRLAVSERNRDTALRTACSTVSTRPPSLLRHVWHYGMSSHDDLVKGSTHGLLDPVRVGMFCETVTKVVLSSYFSDGDFPTGNLILEPQLV